MLKVFTIFNKDIPKAITAKAIPTSNSFYLRYITNKILIDLNKDLATY